jgi:hypothetical protein
MLLLQRQLILSWLAVTAGFAVLTLQSKTACNVMWPQCRSCLHFPCGVFAMLVPLLQMATGSLSR